MAENILCATTNAIMYADVHYNLYTRNYNDRYKNRCFVKRIEEKDIPFTNIKELKHLLGHKSMKINDQHHYVEYFIDLIHE